MDAFSFTWALNFILFCLGINAITYMLRIIVEYFISSDNKLWNKMLLPLSPVIFGGLIAFFAKSYQYFDGNMGNTARIFFGFSAGMFSGLAYQVINGVFKNKVQELKTKLAQPKPEQVQQDTTQEVLPTIEPEVLPPKQD